jgi:hypothetical protein
MDSLPELGNSDPDYLGRLKRFGNAMMPDGMSVDRNGVVYDAGPVKMRLGKNAFQLTPEEAYVLGRKIDANLKLGYDGNHQLDMSAPVGAGTMSYRGNVGPNGNRQELGYEMPLYGGRLKLKGSRDGNGNALSFGYEKKF